MSRADLTRVLNSSPARSSSLRRSKKVDSYAEAPTVRSARSENRQRAAAFEAGLQDDFGSCGMWCAVHCLLVRHRITGVGAVSDARGEITFIGGKLVVSYGKRDARPDPASE
jgi:hypothetical protein